MKYDDGFVQGYEDFQNGCESRFIWRSKTCGTGITTTNGAAVDTADLDEARGYIDGFMHAEADAH